MRSLNGLQRVIKMIIGQGNKTRFQNGQVSKRKKKKYENKQDKQNYITFCKTV